MTTPTTPIDNKAALRASLKKEDESLANRLTDSAGELLADRVLTSVAGNTGQTPQVTSKNIDVGDGPLVSGAMLARGRQASVGKATKEVGKKIDKKAVRAQPRKVGKPAKEVERKPEKMVRCAVALPKSEDAAIDTLRSDLAKTTGWKASKSEIVRAAVQLFAEQKTGAKKELLAAVAPPVKGRKKG
ncbi:MAG: hypothetical protein JNL84_08530 [Candidatus Accumulibacter sp.]|nr:hypothetical protein [Accumulibacter sp.]